jgi:hypothetical protein
MQALVEASQSAEREVKAQLEQRSAALKELTEQVCVRIVLIKQRCNCVPSWKLATPPNRSQNRHRRI